MDDIDKIIAAILALGLIRPHRDGFTGAVVEPTPQAAIVAYRECLGLLEAVESRNPSHP